jgi:hypothetical protein
MDWVQVAQTFGLPVVLLLLLLLALWRVLRWTGDNVVKPLVAKHLEFMDSAMKAMGTLATNMEAQTRSLAQITGALSTVQARLDRPEGSK